MNKYLMLSAAALLAGTAAAQGYETQKFSFGTAGGNSYCDGGEGVWSGNLYTWNHLNADCAGYSYWGGPGIAGKTRGIGKNVVLFDNVPQYSGSYLCSIDFPPKFKIGGTFTLWCVNGSVPFEAGSGVLLPFQGEARKGAKSTRSLLGTLIAEHRSRMGETKN